jgi:hypothetical protein
MEDISVRPNLNHIALPEVKYTDGDEIIAVRGADPNNPDCFITEVEEGGMIVKMVFPPESSAGARWVTRAAAEGMINNEEDGGAPLRLDETIHVRKCLAYSMHLRNEEGVAVWRQACERVKSSRRGVYPRDWGQKILTFYDRNPIPRVELSDICGYSDC